MSGELLTMVIAYGKFYSWRRGVPVLKSKYLERSCYINARRTEYQLSVSVHMYPFMFENGDFFPLV